MSLGLSMLSTLDENTLRSNDCDSYGKLSLMSNAIESNGPLLLVLIDTTFLSLYLIVFGSNDVDLPVISNTLDPSGINRLMCCWYLSSIAGVDAKIASGLSLSMTSMKSAGKGHCGGHLHAVDGTFGVGSDDDGDDDDGDGVVVIGDVDTFNDDDDDDDDDIDDDVVIDDDDDDDDDNLRYPVGRYACAVDDSNISTIITIAIVILNIIDPIIASSSIVVASASASSSSDIG